jgi:primosomal protein N' (replication factor Y)
VTRFARVAVPRPLDRTFLYRIPDNLKTDIEPGCRVVVPFGRRQLTGWVDELVEDVPDPPARIRSIIDAPDPAPVLDVERLSLCRWISHYYAAPLGLTFRAALPAALTSESAERLTLAPGAEASAATSAPEKVLLEALAQHKGPVKLASLRKNLGSGPWSRTALALAQRELLTIERQAPDVTPPLRGRQTLILVRELESLHERDRIFGRARRQRELYEYLESVGGRSDVVHLTRQLGISRSVAHGLVDKGLAVMRQESVTDEMFAEAPSVVPPAPTPTAAQAAAIAALLEASGRPDPGVFVLKGVTGSGKTLVYLEVLRELVTRRGLGAIVLVPEISLTPQTLGRFRAVFGDSVALLHSALSEGERYAAWTALRRGEKRIVIGARSAVFAPVKDLGAIVIDEEHESTYKQSDPAPRYHARDVAVVRAHRGGALCVLGSATPSLESHWNAHSGRWQQLELPERIGARPLPTVHVVDLREERKRERARGESRSYDPLILSPALREAMAVRLDRREQTILLLNRRGYSTFLQCRDCGSVLGCHRCNVSLTLHRRPPRMVCHHCYHQEPVPGHCPACGSPELSHRGVGTEQVERVLGEAFADARIARMDVDTTSAKWAHHEILGRVERREVDILLGTQMIAKGLDFPGVTLVGVINADVGLNLPDFRASERTFQLLTQVAGRAGRGPGSGEVFIQSALPGHYAIRFALSHDYDGFAARELDERDGPSYPPHVRLANLVISGPAEVGVQEAAERAADWLAGLFRSRGIEAVSLLGPAPCPIDRLRNRWRWHLLLKSRDGDALGRVLRFFARRFDLPASDLRLEIDRDPVSLL